MAWYSLGSPEYNNMFGPASGETDSNGMLLSAQPPKGQFSIMPDVISNMIQQAGGIGDSGGGKVDKDGMPVIGLDENGGQVTQQDLLNQKLQQLGISPAVSGDGKSWAYVDKSGQPISGTVNQGADSANGFWNAALLAGGVAGGAAAGAFGGGGVGELAYGGGGELAPGEYAGFTGGGSGAADYGLDAFSPESLQAWGQGAGTGTGETAGMYGVGAATGAVPGASTSSNLGDFNPEGITNPNFGQNADFAQVTGANGGGSSVSDLLSGGNLRGWSDLLRGGAGLYSAYNLMRAGRGTGYSQAASQQLEALLKNPGMLTSLPGYDAGLEAVQRAGAAQGYTGSGNMKIALAKYGGDFYNNTVKQLASIADSGRPVDQQYKFGGLQLFGNALDTLGYGLSRAGFGG